MRRARQVLGKTSGEKPAPAYGPRAPVGIPGFDEIVGGGLPTGHSILILGEPGAGKTVFALQFLINGINRFDENGVYVSLFKNKQQCYDEAKSFGWDFEAAERQKKFMFIDASPMPGSDKTLTLITPDFTVSKLLATVKGAVEEIGAKRMVIDKLSMLDYHFLNERERWRAILEIYLGLLETHATCLLLSDIRTMGSLFRRRFLPEEYLFQGTILMHTISAGRTMERTIQVEKLQSLIDRQPRPYRITENGIEIYPRESVI